MFNDIPFAKDLDPLDPLTEIVRSGQAFSPLIFLERLIWLFIGFFFMGAMTTGLRNGLKDQGWFDNKTSFIGIDKKPDKKNTSLNKNNE
tara:strand:- start:249 stop:515 length:267 start_codon:yes stop_codon:yes gene_type:complete